MKSTPQVEAAASRGLTTRASIWASRDCASREGLLKRALPTCSRISGIDTISWSTIVVMRKVLLFLSLTLREKKKTSCEEIHLITQFGYSLLYCRFSSSCGSIQPQKPSKTIVVFDPVHDLLQNCLSGVWVAFWGIISLIRISAVQGPA